MPKKILVVDDEAAIAANVERIASGLGFDVRTLNDSRHAFATFTEFKPDILILDMMMPEVDGIEVLNQVLAAGTDAKIVVMSGYGAAYMRLADTVADFREHTNIVSIAKPFRRAQLQSLLAPYADHQPLR